MRTVLKSLGFSHLIERGAAAAGWYNFMSHLSLTFLSRLKSILDLCVSILPSARSIEFLKGQIVHISSRTYEDHEMV